VVNDRIVFSDACQLTIIKITTDACHSRTPYHHLDLNTVNCIGKYTGLHHLKFIGMKTIIAPTDFSAVSVNAIMYAADLAVTTRARLILFHVCQLPLVYSEVPMPLLSIGEMTEEANIKMNELKEQVIASHGDKIKISSEVKAGTVVTELKIFCAGIHPYAVVMGTHGATALERFLLGSNTLSAIKNLAWPLIVVPAEMKFNTIRNIGLACDFKKVIDTAPVEEIRNLVKDLGANLHVLYINKDEQKEYTADFIAETGWLQEMLVDLNPRYHFIDHPDVNDGLMEYAESYLLDLLIVVPRKHGVVEKLLHPGHTKQLVLNSRMPMMTIHE
jgi:nucleotide-binding universal stress UspA family protein